MLINREKQFKNPIPIYENKNSQKKELKGKSSP